MTFDARPGVSAAAALGGMLVAIATLATAAAQSPPAGPTREPLVSIWYRGTPAGTPRADELAVIRALGFGGVTWPAAYQAGGEPLAKLAAAAGLEVSVMPRAQALAPDAPSVSGERLDLAITAANVDAIAPIVWRAVARGTRVIAFDAGAATGAGLEESDRSLKPWTRRALDIARQLTTNRRLFTILRPGPGVIVDPNRSPALDVVLLDADRSWLCVATNVSAQPVSARVRLPAGVPYAIWMDMLDGSTLAMIGEPAGPLWTATMPARTARLYVIEKIMK